MAELKFVGLDDLQIDDIAQERVRDLVGKHAERLQRIVNNELELVTHVKAYSKSGGKHKYSVHIKASWPGGTIVSDKAHDWQLMLAMQQGLAAMEQQFRNRFA